MIAITKTQKNKAVRWAKKRAAELRKLKNKNGESIWPEQSIANQVITEAGREFNLGLAKVISKALKIWYKDETEEEITAWEQGE